MDGASGFLPHMDGASFSDGGERLRLLQHLGCSQAQVVCSGARLLPLLDVHLLLLVLYEEVILTRFGFSSNAIFDQQLLLELLPVNYGNA